MCVYDCFLHPLLNSMRKETLLVSKICQIKTVPSKFWFKKKKCSSIPWFLQASLCNLHFGSPTFLWPDALVYLTQCSLQDLSLQTPDCQLPLASCWNNNSFFVGFGWLVGWFCFWTVECKRVWGEGDRSCMLWSWSSSHSPPRDGWSILTFLFWD